MLKFVAFATCIAFIAIAAIGCYHMPTEGDYSLIPATNNPDYTWEKGGDGGLPGIGY